MQESGRRGRPWYSAVMIRRGGGVPARAIGLALACLGWGCASAPGPSPAPPSAPAPEERVAAVVAESEALATALDEAREALSRAWAEVADERLRGIALERRVLELEAAQSAAAERQSALQAELEAALDEVLRSKASLTGGSSRALAASRIAEARAAAQAAAQSGAPAGWLARVDELLERADNAQAAANYPGAAYLAERASQLLRQARLTESASVSLPPAPELVAPLVPAEPRTANQPANLRVGPGLDYDRIAVLEVGEEVRAVAQAGEWLQVERLDGTRGWVHARLTDAR